MNSLGFFVNDMKKMFEKFRIIFDKTMKYKK